MMPYSLKLINCIFSWFIDNMHCVDNW